MINLITGGAGFIGSHLAEKLLKMGEKVYVIDDLSTGRIDNIEHLKNYPNFHYTIESIMDIPVLAELVDRCDIVYHLAAAVGVRLVVENPVRTIETNIRGTENVLQVATKKKKKVLITSTSEVYGNSASIPFKEEQPIALGNIYSSRWSYACSKALDEFLALAYYEQKHLPVVIVRLFNTIGPRQTGKYGMVVPTFVRQAILGHPLTVYGDGKQSRSFAYVGDIVDGIINLSREPQAVGKVVNLGSDKEINIEELAKLVLRVTNSSSKIEYVPYEKAYGKNFEDMRRRVPDILQAKQLIGFQPTKGIERTLEIITDYFLTESLQEPLAWLGKPICKAI